MISIFIACVVCAVTAAVSKSSGKKTNRTRMLRCVKRDCQSTSAVSVFLVRAIIFFLLAFANHFNVHLAVIDSRLLIAQKKKNLVPSAEIHSANIIK